MIDEGDIVLEFLMIMSAASVWNYRHWVAQHHIMGGSMSYQLDVVHKYTFASIALQHGIDKLYGIIL